MNSWIACVHKKYGSFRLCIDYRDLSRKTLLDCQPILRDQDILDSLVMVFCNRSGQGFMSPESRAFKAYSTPWELYEWVHISFTLMNAPAAFQHFMWRSAWMDLGRKFVCTSWMISWFSTKTFDRHLEAMRKVLQQLQAHEVKMKPWKVSCSKY